MAAFRPFMTLAMRLAWLLRADVRADAPLADEEAQREFAIWWLLYGRAEYPGAWWYGPDQATVAMDPVVAPGGTTVPRLPYRAWRGRADLQATFPLADAGSVAELCCWYRLVGPRELDVAPALSPELQALTEQPSPHAPWSDAGTAVPRLAAMMHASSAELQEAFDPALPEHRVALADWYGRIGRRTLPAPTHPPCRPEPLPRPASAYAGPARPPGVNLVGFARAELGVGEDVRMMSAALDAVGIAHVVLDVPGSLARRADAAVAAHLADAAIHPVTVFCLTAFDTARLYLERGRALFDARARVGLWAWELPDDPADWRDAFALVDEVWAASDYTRAAFAAATERPVHLLPPAVALPVMPAPDRAAIRAAIGLPDPAILFVYPFDPNSYLARKNPAAAVRAFRQAFPPRSISPGDPAAVLLLRVNGDPEGMPGWPEVAQAIDGDPRILLRTGTMDRADALALLASADCLVSPHRAEGFGRNIAEARLLGVPVLATGFSGCADFLLPDEMIAWTRAPVAEGAYPGAAGSWWAEPSVDDLAARMRVMAHGGAPPPAERAARRRAILAKHGTDPAGRRYVERLMALGAVRAAAL